MADDSTGYQLPATSSPDQSGSNTIVLDVVCKDRDRPTPCLDYHIKQCTAPCIGRVTPEQYRKKSIDGVIAFFQGKYQEIEEVLMAEMQKAATEKKFERAATLRDHLRELQAMQEKQLVSDTSRANTDVIGAALLSGHAHIVLMQERNGKMIGEESFSLRGQADSLGEVLAQFIPQYYADAADLPDTILTGEAPDDQSDIGLWLSNLRGKKVSLHVPERGKKSKLLLLAEKNADWKAKQSEAKWESDARKAEDAVSELQRLLSLPTAPNRIEGYDISHMGGSETVGSMVVFCNGKPKREHYRSFNVRTLKGGKIDDYQSLKEVLTRRLKYLTADRKREEAEWNEKGITFGKARKDEQAFIQQTVDGEKEECKYPEFVVARHEEQVIAFVRLCSTGKYMELTSIWMSEEYQAGDLGAFLIRKTLRQIKKGKVYTLIASSMEQYYATLGFRYVIKPPPTLQEKLEKIQAVSDESGQYIAMVYDTKDNRIDESFTSCPDLILIDGGKGQLQMGIDVLAHYHLDIPVASLAKREEEIFVPGSSTPVPVPKESPAQFLLQRLRDEAHRFANFKREGRGKRSMTKSVLDEVPSIGDITKKQLLDRFGSVDDVRRASDAQLREVLSETQLEELRGIL